MDNTTYVTPQQVAKKLGKSRIWVNKKLQAGADIPGVLWYRKMSASRTAPYLIAPDKNYKKKK